MAKLEALDFEGRKARSRPEHPTWGAESWMVSRLQEVSAVKNTAEALDAAWLASMQGNGSSPEVRAACCIAFRVPSLEWRCWKPWTSAASRHMLVESDLRVGRRCD